MTSVNVRLVYNRTKVLQGEIRDTAERVVRKTALDILNDAMHLAPVDTGALKNSLAPGGPGNIFDMAVGSRGGRNIVATIGTSVPYAPHQEYGTRFMAAHPFLIPAVERNRAVFIAAMSHLLKDA